MVSLITTPNRSKFWLRLFALSWAALPYSPIETAVSQQTLKPPGHPSVSSDQATESLIQPDIDDLFESKTATEPEATGESSASRIPSALSEYMGRQIARTMHYSGAEWLIRDTREREERCSLMLANLGVRPGMTICDMGCGNGYYTLSLAKLTGARGHVVGVDVQPEMLKLLRERMEEQGIENVIPVLGSFHNPHLPPRSLDMVLLVDVYHEFSHPQQMLAAMRRSLKPNGVIVLAEYRQEDPNVPIKPLHKMSKKQVDVEMTANGFKLVRSYDELPWQHLLFYGIDGDWDGTNAFDD